MKLVAHLRRTLVPCFRPKPSIHPIPAAAATAIGAIGATGAFKNRLSTTLADILKDYRGAATEPTPDQEEDSLIDAAASASRPPTSSPTRSVIVGTIYGHRGGRVSFCVQHDPSTPPPFLFDLSLPTNRLAQEMRAGILRIALECHRGTSSRINEPGRVERRAQAPVWRVYCNGRRMGYAMKRRPTEKEMVVLQKVRAMSAGAGVLGEAVVGSGGKEEGELIYMRASYKRVVGSRDTVSYHLINPGGGSPSQELSIFVLRTG